MSKHSHKPTENQAPPVGQDSGGTQDVQEKPGESGGTAQDGHVSETSGEKAAGGEPTSADLTRDFEAKLAELNDQYLRKVADFENYRKRMVREKQELTDFANQNLLLDLLPVIDDFERAIKSAETSKDFASFFEGVKMIEKQLSTMLDNKWGLKRFDSEGALFDPNRHEAIQMEKSPEISEAVVKDDYLKGYLLKDRVIRFAKVKVLMPEGGAAAPGGEKNSGE